MPEAGALRIAVPPTSIRPDGIEICLRTIATWARAAAVARARLLVLPQLFLTGAAVGDALLSDGPELVLVARIAREHGVAIACGYLEQCTGRYHDAALFVDDRGCALANYRRTHFVPGREPEQLAIGHWLTVVPFAGRKWGLLIGADVEAPEVARALVLAGAEGLLVLAGHGEGRDIVSDVLLPARAYENGCAVAYANAGGAGAPSSRIVAADGSLLAVAETEPASAAVLSAGGTAGRVERRPQLYRRLTALESDPQSPRI